MSDAVFNMRVRVAKMVVLVLVDLVRWQLVLVNALQVPSKSKKKFSSKLSQARSKLDASDILGLNSHHFKFSKNHVMVFRRPPHIMFQISSCTLTKSAQVCMCVHVYDLQKLMF